MKLKELVKELKANVLTPDTYDPEYEVNYAFSSDLMSDALMLLRTAPGDFFEEGLLITGLATNQSIRTAEMLDFRVVIMVRNKMPNQSVLEGAIDSDITVITSPCSMFSASGILWEKGVRGVTDL